MTANGVGFSSSGVENILKLVVVMTAQLQIYLKTIDLYTLAVACGVLIPQPAIKPTLPALGALGLNHWITGPPGKPLT